MAMSAAQYQLEAEAALTKAKSLMPNIGAYPDKAVVWAQIAANYGYLFEIQSKIDGTIPAPAGV